MFYNTSAKNPYIQLIDYYCKMKSPAILILISCVMLFACQLSGQSTNNAESAEWVNNYADLKCIDEVRRCIYNSFSWKNIDDLEWSGRIVIRFVLTPEHSVESIMIRPENLTPSIREELIRCIKTIDFRKRSCTANMEEKIQFVFPYNLFTLMQYESSDQ